MESQNPRRSSTASAPFDKADADVVLRSSDEVNFHVYIVILRMASNFFDDIFSLPQSAKLSSTDTHPTTGVPIITVSEDAKTLDSLLRLCYPTTDPVLEDVEELSSVLSAAKKYDMEYAVERIKKSALLVPPKGASCSGTMYVYARAIQLEDEDLAAIAAVASFEWKTIEYVLDMDGISAGALYRLLQFRRNRSVNLGYFTFCHPTPPTLTSLSVAMTGENPRETSTNDTSHDMVTTTMSIIFNHASSNIILRSSDNVEFMCSESILMHASPILAEAIANCSRENRGQLRDLPMISVPENCRILQALLQICYPMEEPAIEGLDDTVALYATAVKYQMSFAATFARRKFARNIGTDPLRAYFIAMKHQWVEEARIAAKQAVFLVLDSWVPEMEEVSASAYRQLLDYRSQHHEIVLNTSRATAESMSQPCLLDAPHWSDVDLEKTDRSDWSIDKVLARIHATLASTSWEHSNTELLAVALSHVVVKRQHDDSLRNGQRLATELQDALTSKINL